MGPRTDRLGLVGKKINDYLVKRFIAVGGYSHLYQAEFRPNDSEEKPEQGESEKKEVVLKILDPKMFERPLELNRSLHEGKILSNLNHPGIIGYQDSNFVINGTLRSHYLVLEYFPYQDLDLQIEKGHSAKWGLDKKIEVVLNVSKALHYLHENDIMHLDIKPGNILCNDKKTKLVDFFLSKYINKSSLNPLQKKDVIYGTPDFISKEQLMGREEPASDIYSLGVVFYCLVQNYISPFPGLEEMGCLRRLIQEPFVLHHHIKRSPTKTQNIILGMTEPKPQNRPSDSELISELEKTLN